MSIWCLLISKDFASAVELNEIWKLFESQEHKGRGGGWEHLFHSLILF